MRDAQIRTVNLLLNFGFDEFMSNQIAADLENAGLLLEEDNNSIGAIYDVLRDHGMDQGQSMNVVQDMQKKGILFRRRLTNGDRISMVRREMKRSEI